MTNVSLLKTPAVDFHRLQDFQRAVFDLKGHVFGKVEISIQDPLERRDDLHQSYISVLRLWHENVELGGIAQYSLREGPIGLLTKSTMWYDPSEEMKLQAIGGFLMIGKTFASLDEISCCVNQVDRAHRGLYVSPLGYSLVSAHDGEVHIASWGPRDTFDPALLTPQGRLLKEDCGLTYRFETPTPDRRINALVYF